MNSRGYRPGDYKVALQTLLERRWVTYDAGIYRLTDPGRRIRSGVERLTDDTFYAPWACLRSNEWAQLYKLLTKLETAV